MTLVERARRLIAQCPPAISGQGGHSATFRVACALVWGYGFSPGEAMPLMMEYNGMCQPPWSQHELWHKLRSALSASHKQPRGHLVDGDAEKGVLPDYEAPKKKSVPTFDLEALKRAQEPAWKVDAAFLRARSPVDPRSVDLGQVLDLLYGADDCVMVFGKMRSLGDWMRWRGRWFELGKSPQDKARPVQKVPDRTKEGMIWLIQPVDGQWHQVRGEARLSRRTLASAKRYPYVLLESDKAPADLWLNMLCRLPIPVCAVVTSGGRSVHALVKIGCDTLTDWKETVALVRDNLAALGCDHQALSNPMVNMRCPNVMREGKMTGGKGQEKFVPYPHGPNKQTLLYLNPNARAEAIGRNPIYDHEAPKGGAE